MSKGNTMTTKPQTTLATVKYWVMLNSLLGLFIGLLMFFNQPQPEQIANPVLVEQTVQPTGTTTGTKTDELAGLPYVSRDSLQQQAVSYQTIAARQTQQQPRIRARSSR